MEIWEKDKRYSFFRKYVALTVRRCFRRFRCRGKQNIPTDGAVIIAPNHCNTLMDALVVLSTRQEPMVFGARADVFKNPIFAKFLKFCKMVPMVRARDGLRNVEKNRETMETIYEAMNNNLAFVVFPEGTHRTKHSLLPIKKGIARIALTAEERFGKDKKVYIVPCGIEYGDYFHFRTTCRVAYGKPIDISSVIKDNSDVCEAELHAIIQEKVKLGISKLITYVEDDENYDAKWAKINARRQGKPSIWWATLLVLLFPVWLVCCVLAAPQLVAAKILLGKIKDPAFSNTMRFACKLIGTPIALILWMILAAVLKASWWVTLVLAIAVMFAMNGFYDYLEFARLYKEAGRTKKMTR